MLERETSLRQRLAQIEIALTVQQGEGAPGLALAGEGFCAKGGESAARQKIAVLEASLQACYRQLDLARCPHIRLLPDAPAVTCYQGMRCCTCCHRRCYTDTPQLPWCIAPHRLKSE